MNKIFLIDGKREYTYESFIKDLQLIDHCPKYIYVRDNEPYQIFLAIVHSLLYEYSIELLDGDFSSHELNTLAIDEKQLNASTKVEEYITISSVSNLFDLINKNIHWSLTLYTSGTTGRPKKVKHSFQSLTRNVKVDSKFKNDVWAFAYNPTHMAGLQVFFQAFMNMNTIVYVFGSNQSKLSDYISKYSVTNISATATFYRNIIPYLKGYKYDSVKRITFGGEKYDIELEKAIKSIFPKGEIRNIYASTEAGSLFMAQGETFYIPIAIRDYIKFNKNAELLIHKNLIGSSSSLILEGEWYNTGDLVEIIDENHFIFKTRASDLINVGGYKVNPLEVESVLQKVSGVIDVVVKAKDNKVTGQIVVIDVVKEKDFEELPLKKSIKQFAKKHLQEWKIPRVINFVEAIPKNRAGKKDRK